MKLLRRVVKPRDQQRDDFQPQAHLVQAANGVENRADTAAKLVIVAIVKTLKIYLVEINPRTQIFEHLRRAIPVGNKASNQPCRFGFFENCDRPFTGDQRFVIRAD